ncbi:MAG: hypothetical protein SVV80_06550 [Planctomycetota bacterium]|nr:hypothetical protein [Planctomycetota bacterium]
MITMRFWNRKLTVAGIVGWIACIFTLFGAICYIDMVGVRRSISAHQNQPQSPTLGQTGFWIVALAPLLGALAGWLVLRGRRNVLRQIAAIVVGVVVWFAFFAMGSTMVSYAYPVLQGAAPLTTTSPAESQPTKPATQPTIAGIESNELQP